MTKISVCQRYQVFLGFVNLYKKLIKLEWHSLLSLKKVINQLKTSSQVCKVRIKVYQVLFVKLIVIMLLVDILKYFNVCKFD